MKFRIIQNEFDLYEPQVYDEKKKKYLDLYAGSFNIFSNLTAAEVACQEYKRLNEGPIVIKEFEL
jgi:hypothetical protein